MKISDATPGKRAAVYGVLTALALVLGYAESLVPAFFAVPGMKLGLTNVVVITALYLMGDRAAFFINLVRILLIAFLFGNGVSLIYSLSGGILSTLVMIMLKRTGSFGMRSVSAAGGVSHNAGQIMAAMLLLRSVAPAWYLIFLWPCGIAAGIAVGLLGGLVTSHLPASGTAER